jgi:hypothetical protein
MPAAVGKRDASCRERERCDAPGEGGDDVSFIDELHEDSFLEVPPPS